VLSDTPCERIRKWEVCDFQRGQIVVARLAGASVAKIACYIIWCIENERQFLRLCRHTEAIITRTIIKSRRMRWASHVAYMGEKKNAYRLLVGKPEGKRTLGRPRHRWVDNIRMDLGEVGWDDVDWIGLAQDRNRRRALVNSVLNLRVP
jgi:hypothetical protein